MESRRLSIRIPDPSLDRLESRLDQQGQTVTEAVLAAIASYVGDNERLPFSLALYGHRWRHAMELWTDLAFELIRLKPHKSRFFQRGFLALSLIQEAFDNLVPL